MTGIRVVEFLDREEVTFVLDDKLVKLTLVNSVGFVVEFVLLDTMLYEDFVVFEALVELVNTLVFVDLIVSRVMF